MHEIYYELNGLLKKLQSYDKSSVFLYRKTQHCKNVNSEMLFISFKNIHEHDFLNSGVKFCIYFSLSSYSDCNYMDNVSKSVKNSNVLVIYFLSFKRFLCRPFLIFIEFVKYYFCFMFWSLTLRQVVS